MSSKNKEKKEYVSWLRSTDVPILPPILSEEDRQQCRLWRKEAILKERELEIRRRERELGKLKSNRSPSECCRSKELTHGSRGYTIEEFIRETLDNPPDLEFKLLLEYVKKEIENFLHESLGYPSNCDFKFLLNELKEELQKRQELKRSQMVSHSEDSTFRDVAHLSLNRELASVSRCSTIQEEGSTCFDRSSGNNSVVNEPICLSSESTFKHLESFSSPEEISLSRLTSTPALSQRTDLRNEFLEYSFSARNQPHIEDSKAEELAEAIDSPEEGMHTPPKLIRRNSYTLESPSPSVVAYLRNLSLVNSTEKNPDESNVRTNSKDISEYNDVSNKGSHENSSRSVVKNLNSLWDAEVSDKKNLADISPDCRDSLEDVDESCFIESDQNKNVMFYDKNSIAENGVHQYSNGMSESAYNVPDYMNDEAKVKAAVIIQSYARGYLVRRLMKTYKVDIIKNTIKDAVVCAWGLYGEQAVTPADINLHERLIQQVTAACYELHSIFFKWSTAEKMGLIRSDRERLKNPKPKPRNLREKRTSESESLSTSSSRSTSRSRTHVTAQPTHRRTKSQDSELKRPSTLPTIPKSTTMNYKPWR